jgi:hypothetical protein
MQRKLVRFARALPFQVQTKPNKATRDGRTRQANGRTNHALDVRMNDRYIASFIIILGNMPVRCNGKEKITFYNEKV